MTIFLTDDDADDCLLFAEALRETMATAQLSVVSEGSQLLELLQNRPAGPALLFLDLNMPKMNGFECLEQIRAIPELIDLPVIIFSTSSNRDIVDRTYKTGATLFISKPNSFQLLKKTIGHILDLGLERLEQKPAREQYLVQLS